MSHTEKPLYIDGAHGMLLSPVDSKTPSCQAIVVFENKMNVKENGVSFSRYCDISES